MATFQEILADRTTYPDDRTITMPGPDGQMVSMTMAEVRNQAIGKGDYTKESQRWATEKAQLDQQYRQTLGNFSQQLQALNAELARRNEAPIRTQDEFEERLAADASDPTLGPYAKHLKKLSKEVEELRQEKEDNKRRLAQHEQAFWLNQHSQVLSKIQERDEEFRSPEKTQGLIQYAQQHGLANLDLAYQLMTRDRDIERAKTTAAKEAETRAAEQAKVNAAQPHIPGGSKAASPASAGQSWQPSQNSLDPFEEAMNAATNDPELESIGMKFAEQFGSGR